MCWHLYQLRLYRRVDLCSHHIVCRSTSLSWAASIASEIATTCRSNPLPTYVFPIWLALRYRLTFLGRFESYRPVNKLNGNNSPLVIDGHCYSTTPILDTAKIPIRRFKNRRSITEITITKLILSLGI